MPTSWTSTCAWCQQTFTADRPRSFCSPLCRDRYRWHGGIVPDRVRFGWRAEVERRKT